MKIHKLTAIIFTLAFILIQALPSAAQDREDYRAGGDYAANFCEANPDSETSLLGAMVAGDVFSFLFTMPESKRASISGNELNDLADEQLAVRQAQFGGEKFATCENVALEMFDCMDYYFYLAKEMAPKKASRKEIESIFYDLADAGEVLGADGLCGKVSMEFSFKSDGERSTADVILYEFEDEWYPLTVY